MNISAAEMAAIADEVFAEESTSGRKWRLVATKPAVAHAKPVVHSTTQYTAARPDSLAAVVLCGLYDGPVRRASWPVCA